MKSLLGNVICFAFIAVFLFVTPPLLSKTKNKTKVFLLAGQSNMVGVGKIIDLKKPFNQSPTNVQIWIDNKWLPLSSIIKEKDGKFGPEVSFAYTISKAMPDYDIRLIKFAVGGTALYNDWAPKTGKEYLTFMKTANDAITNLDDANIKYDIAGMLWLQGESDAHENQAGTYKKNLIAFIADMRLNFKTPEMPFIIARILDHFGKLSGQAKIVRDAQVNIADSIKNVGWFNTDDCEQQIEGHYNSVGLIKIGNRFADKYMEIADKKFKKNKKEK